MKSQTQNAWANLMMLALLASQVNLGMASTIQQVDIRGVDALSNPSITASQELPGLPDFFPESSVLFSPTALSQEEAGSPRTGELNQAGVPVLTKDPGRLFYSTYLGGNDQDSANAIAVGPDGAVYVAGQTLSMDFPDMSGLVYADRDGGQYDAFIVKLDPTGSSLIYSIKIGGSSNERVGGIVVDSSGSVYIIGTTWSPDFPTSSQAFDTNCNGGEWGSQDVFVVKVASDGKSLVYSTCLGGKDIAKRDEGQGIALDQAGNVYLTGTTGAKDFPVTIEALMPSLDNASGMGPTEDAFLVKLNSTGSALVYATYLGGSDYDQGTSIAIDSQGQVYVLGTTKSEDFPVTLNAYDTTYPFPLPNYSNAKNCFVAKLNATLSALEYATFLGGNRDENCTELALDATGSAFITGDTTSEDFPTTSAAFIPQGQNSDAFIVKLSPDGSDLSYASFLGGSQSDFGKGIAIAETGEVFITGMTNSSDFPVTPNAYSGVKKCGSSFFNAFVARLNLVESYILYATFLGGCGNDYGNAIALDDSGAVSIAGETRGDFPVINALLPEYAGGLLDGFVVKLEAPTYDYPTVSPVITLDPEMGCAGLTVSVSGRDFPSGSYYLTYDDERLGSGTTASVDTTLSTTFIVPDNTTGGYHTVTAIQQGNPAIRASAQFRTPRTDLPVVLIPGVSGSELVAGSSFYFMAPPDPNLINTDPLGIIAAANLLLTSPLTPENHLYASNEVLWLDAVGIAEAILGRSRYFDALGLNENGVDPVRDVFGNAADIHVGDILWDINISFASPDLAPLASVLIDNSIWSLPHSREFFNLLQEGNLLASQDIDHLLAILSQNDLFTSADVRLLIQLLREYNLVTDLDPRLLLDFLRTSGSLTSPPTFVTLDLLIQHQLITSPDIVRAISILRINGLLGSSDTVAVQKVLTDNNLAQLADVQLLWQTLATDNLITSPNVGILIDALVDAQLMTQPDIEVLLEILEANGFLQPVNTISLLRFLREKNMFLSADINNLLDLLINQNMLAEAYLRDLFSFQIAFSVIDKDVYRGLRFFLAREGYVEGETFFYFPYDWRKDVTDTASALDAVINQALQRSGQDQVVILAHSLGGIVARSYLAQYGTSKVDQVISMGTPYLGSPKVASVLEVGDSWGVKQTVGDSGLSFGMHPMEIAKISRNFPVSYQLSPTNEWFLKSASSSPEYSSYITRTTRTITPTGYDVATEYLDYGQTLIFLRGRYNSSLVDNLQDFYDLGVGDLSLMTDSYFAQRILGTNSPTYGHIEFTSRRICVQTYVFGRQCITYDSIAIPHEDFMGDGTVPVFSAMGYNLPSGDNRYYEFPGVGHVALPTNSNVQELLGRMLRGEVCCNSQVQGQMGSGNSPAGKRLGASLPVAYFSTAPLAETGEDDDLVFGTEIQLIGTAALDIYDSANRHTGPVPKIPFAIEKHIPGAGYEVSNGAVVAVLPDGVYTIKLPGTQDQGAAQLRLNRLSHGEVIESLVFESIPTSKTSMATLTMNTANFDPELTLKYKYDEQSPQQEIGVLSHLTGVESEDILPPVSTIALGTNNLVTITAEDNPGGAGVYQILFSTEDEPTTYQVYGDPFQLPEGSERVTAIALDLAGNAEYPSASVLVSSQPTPTALSQEAEEEEGTSTSRVLLIGLIIGGFILVAVLVLALFLVKRKGRAG